MSGSNIKYKHGDRKKNLTNYNNNNISLINNNL